MNFWKKRDNFHENLDKLMENSLIENSDILNSPLIAIKQPSLFRILERIFILLPGQP